MIITSKILVTILSLNFADAITFFPFIFINKKSLRTNKVLMNHERIHLRQQLELGLLFFYLLYAAEYAVSRIKGKSHFTAYRAISFEREAYAKQHIDAYLKERRFWSFWKYI